MRSIASGNAMKFTGFVFFISFFSVAQGETLCFAYTQCREQLLTRRWLCAEEARKMTAHPCRLVDDFKAIWKGSLWREKVFSHCLSKSILSTPNPSECPPEDSSLILSAPLESPLECGLAMNLHEERCDRLKSCCPEEKECFGLTLDLPAVRQLERRLRLASSRAASCRRRMFAAIYSDMTREDSSIAKNVAQHSGTVLDLLASLTKDAAKFKLVNRSSSKSSIPTFFRLNKNRVLRPVPKTAAGVASKELKQVQLQNVDHDSNRPSAIKIEATAYHSRQNNLYQELQPTIRKPWSTRKLNSTGKLKKVKTLFTRFLSAKNRSMAKPWKSPPVVEAVPELFLLKQNTSHPIGNFVARVTEEEIVRDELNKFKKGRVVETTKKPILHQEIQEVIQITDDKKTILNPKKVLENAEKSSSEEDFDKEFEKKAGSLVSFGPNALPLPGTRSRFRTVVSARVDDPFVDVAEKSELLPADVSDLIRTTHAPVMRPKLRPTTFKIPLVIHTLAPQPHTTTATPLWNPYLNFFTTPGPLVWRTALPLQLWPLKKRRRKYKGAKTFADEESSPEVSNKILPIPKEEPKNSCPKLRECFIRLEEKEKQCAPISKHKGLSKKKSSFCENLTKRLKIEDMFMALDHDYKSCVVSNEISQEIVSDCAIVPDLPEEIYTTRDCGRNLVALRQHCDHLATCCPTARSCRSTIDSSQAAADLRLRQRRLAMLAKNCEKSNALKGSIKTKKKKLPQRIEGEARLEQ